MRKATLFGMLLTGSALLTSGRTQAQNPIQAAEEAYQAQRRQAQQKGAQQEPHPTTTPSADRPEAGDASAPAADGSKPQAVALDLSRMPDVVGVRVGVSPQEALQMLHRQYPGDRYVQMTNNAWPGAQKPDYGYNIIQTDPLGTPDAYLSFTAPPSPQIVWRITRFTHRIHTNRALLLAALRGKYGKESMAYPPSGGQPTDDDSQIGQMVWLLNEQGARVPLPPARFFPGYNNVWDCSNAVGALNPQPAMPEDEALYPQQLFPGWCSNFVGIRVSLAAGESSEIIENTTTEMMDVPLAVRTAHAATVWKRDLAKRLQQEDLQKSKQAKPNL
jgi:hypothetical protein